MPFFLGGVVRGLVPSEGGLETVAFTAAASPVSMDRFDTGVCPPLGFFVDPVFFAAIAPYCILYFYWLAPLWQDKDLSSPKIRASIHDMRYCPAKKSNISTILGFVNWLRVNS
jgi:hypothetical protein